MQQNKAAVQHTLGAKLYVVSDDVTSFSRFKTSQIHVNVCDTVQLLAGSPQCNGGKLKEAEDFKCVFSFIEC